ncbi:hypothetical protein HYC85_014242 [Camellia sinensis]|uniref:phosphoribosylformylglycinamidine cyclo-ligase n=1 Tax=Camellia sinensis TaxID=4442 RepID=A0A7J7H6Y9_CAMSI|nr:hypothetical protein HYC85_014242 [Camellia sinensis]
MKNKYKVKNNNHSESSGSSSGGGLTYKDAGVDIDAGSELVRRIAKMAPVIGGFGGLFPLGDSYLVAGTDGVGTKLKLAFETGIHETTGIDLVIKGIVDGCQQSDCALLGRESITICAFQAAEMPNFYADGEYDLSGFAVGIVKRDSVIDGKNITVGDVLVGLPSSGVHSNASPLPHPPQSPLSPLHHWPSHLTHRNCLLDLFTGLYHWKNLHHAVMENDGKEQRHKNDLLHMVLAQSGLSLNNQLPGETVTLGEALMVPTVIYVKQAGKIEDAEMRRTFNMGIGMVLVVSQEAAHRILGDAKGAYTAYRIGEVVSGDSVSYQ